MNPKKPNRRPTKPIEQRTGLQWEQLEPRILYSAAPAEAPVEEAPPEAESADVANATPVEAKSLADNVTAAAMAIRVARAGPVQWRARESISPRVTSRRR